MSFLASPKSASSAEAYNSMVADVMSCAKYVVKVPTDDGETGKKVDVRSLDPQICKREGFCLTIIHISKSAGSAPPRLTEA